MGVSKIEWTEQTWNPVTGCAKVSPICKHCYMQPEWALALRDHCRATGVAFTFKQWGAWGPDGVRRDQKANGRLLAGQVWNERPELNGALL